MSVATRYSRIAEEVACACREVGRDPREVVLVAVSKTVDAEVVGQAVSAGAHDFGENRPDGLEEKQAAYPDATWHFIGNIQSRRIADIVRRADLIHSLYEERHADRIDAAAEALGKVQDVLLEVNVSGEESKSGLTPEDVSALLAHCLKLEHVRVCGLMTMAPQGDLEVARKSFEDLRIVRAKLKAEPGEC
ncbi:MAG: YggS family pyridoxal phosphate-dependent enzyme, partial [Raoultibacter sp.]